jgi:hypothetical protein
LRHRYILHTFERFVSIRPGFIVRRTYKSRKA